MDTDLVEIRPPQVAAAALVVAALRPNEDLACSLDVMVSRLRELMKADGVVIELEQEDCLICCYASGLTWRWLGRKRPIVDSLGGTCFQKDEPVLSGTVQNDPVFSGSASSEPAVRSMVSVPLRLTGPSVGVVRIMSGTEGFFSDDDLVVARLVTASIRRVLMRELREEPEAGPHGHRVVEALWSLRDRRRSQKRLAGDPDYEVSMLVFTISGDPTSENLGRLRMLVRASDHCLQEDAGTYAIVMPGASVEEAMVAGARIRRELLAFAAAADQDTTVTFAVHGLLPTMQARTA